jgi:hypothetical protein
VVALPVIPALGRLRRENDSFETSLDYVVKPFSKKKKTKKQKNNCDGEGELKDNIFDIL